MTVHLAEISSTVTPGAHAVFVGNTIHWIVFSSSSLLDQAGWHLSGALDIRSNITLRGGPRFSTSL